MYLIVAFRQILNFYFCLFSIFLMNMFANTSLFLMTEVSNLLFIVYTFEECFFLKQPMSHQHPS